MPPIKLDNEEINKALVNARNAPNNYNFIVEDSNIPRLENGGPSPTAAAIMRIEGIAPS